MKKTSIFLLVLVLSFAFCSCNSGSEQEPTSQENEISERSESETMTDESGKSEIAERLLTVEINGTEYAFNCYDNETAQAFVDMMPLTLDMNELNGNEKYYYFSSALPANSSAVGKINVGDIMLYGDNCLVVFYDSFDTKYSYTKIGHIENCDNLAEIIGSGNAVVNFNVK